jgi:hypothetical protein
MQLEEPPKSVFFTNSAPIQGHRIEVSIAHYTPDLLYKLK